MIYKRGDVWWMDFTVNGARVRETCATTDKKQAQELHDKKRAELWARGKLGKKSRKTWADAAKQWEVEKSHKRSWHDDKAKLELLAPKLDGLFLEDIDRELVAELVKDFDTPATKNRYTALIRSILRAAARLWKWTDTYPALLILPENNKRKVRLEGPQAVALIQALPEKYQPAAKLACLTGMRAANVFGLRWSDVDLKKRTAWIEPEHAKGKERITVPLSKPVVELLLTLRGNGSEFVLGGMKQVPFRIWKRAVAQAGLDPENFCWHDWRHVWCSWQLDMGTPKSVIMEMAGWKTDSMVERYGCAAGDVLLERADAITAFLGHGTSTSQQGQEEAAEAA